MDGLSKTETHSVESEAEKREREEMLAAQKEKEEKYKEMIENLENHLKKAEEKVITLLDDSKRIEIFNEVVNLQSPLEDLHKAKDGQFVLGDQQYSNLHN